MFKIKFKETALKKGLMLLMGGLLATGTLWVNSNHMMTATAKRGNPAPKMITFGDSITYGWDGYERVANPYPTILHNRLGVKVKNAGVIGAQLSPNSASNHKNTLQSQVTRNYKHLKNYQVATIFMGINDYHHSTASLSTVKHQMSKQIARIKKANPKIKILAILPMQSYHVNHMTKGFLYEPEFDRYGKGGYTLNQLRAMELKVYHKYNIKVYHNFPTTITPKYMGDSRLHPNQKYYNYMGNHLAKFVHSNVKWKKTYNTASPEKVTSRLMIPMMKINWI